MVNNNIAKKILVHPKRDMRIFLYCSPYSYHSSHYLLSKVVALSCSCKNYYFLEKMLNFRRITCVDKKKLGSGRC